MIIRKRYKDILSELKRSYGSASVYFECLSKAPASASLCVERIDLNADSGSAASKVLRMTFGQSSTSGQSIDDMRARIRVYETAVEYGEMLKATLEANGYTFEGQSHDQNGKDI